MIKVSAYAINFIICNSNLDGAFIILQQVHIIILCTDYRYDQVFENVSAKDRIDAEAASCEVVLAIVKLAFEEPTVLKNFAAYLR
jgi:hypothetical protein